jgi:hypothetical protein
MFSLFAFKVLLLVHSVGTFRLLVFLRLPHTLRSEICMTSGLTPSPSSIYNLLAIIHMYDKCIHRVEWSPFVNFTCRNIPGLFLRMMQCRHQKAE